MKERDTTFTILSAIAMVLVMLGHLGYDLLTFGGLFPYYSYHVLIFVFISGYFYKPENEEHIGKYIIHKLKTLIIPYLIWNIIYGLITLLLHQFGFFIGEEFNIWNIIVAPFVGGHQFMYNATAWFVPALFMLEVCNIFARSVLRHFKLTNEWILFIMYLMVGIFAVYMAIRGSVYDYYKIPGRIMVMAPLFGLGRVYRTKLQILNKVSPVIYIPVLFLINYLLVKTQGGLAYSVVWVTGFANGPLIPFVTAITGIMLWLCISRSCSGFIDRFAIGEKIPVKALKYFGNNTFSVMMHQLIVFMGIKEIFYLIFKNGAGCSDFDALLYHTDVYYTYVPGGIEAFKLIYLIVGIVVSLLICRATGYILNRIGINK